MVSLKSYFAFTRLYLLITGMMWLIAVDPSTTYGQTTAPAPLPALTNPNPNNFDSAKIMQAFYNPHSDLVLISAHRGLHALAGTGQAPGVPENSLEAIGVAAQQGWETVEVDVRLSSDGVPILSHDRTWGREWCGLSSFPGSYVHNPFIPPGNPTNDSTNPAVNATTLSNTRSYFGHTILRDSVGFYCGPVASGFGEYPPTLQDVYDYIKKNTIQMVLVIDVQTREAARAAWLVTKANVDAQGRDSKKSTIYKMPLGLFSSTSDFINLFGSLAPQVNFIPVITTSAIAPVNTVISDDEAGGFDTSSSGTTGFGSEQDIIALIRSFENGIGVHLAGIEVVLKESGGILTSVLTAARNNPATGGPMTVGNFNPVGEYYPNGDTSKPEFFSSLDGHCCVTLDNYLYNNPNHTGPIDPSQPVDNADNRRSLDFIIGTGNQFVTTDDPNTLASRLAGLGKRNISYLQSSTSSGSGGGSGGASASTCNIYASGGTPCVAAHSTVRALFGGYSGRLYQVKRASDGATTDIGASSSNGYADAAKQDSFCAGTACTIIILYDQTSFHNDLIIEGPGGAAPSPDSGAAADALPINVNGNKAYGVKVTPGVGYRNNATNGVARGGSPEGMYMVTSGTYVNDRCCFDYGNAETSGNDTGNGHMDALNFGTACVFGPCSGSGPWVEADLENGQYMGNGSNLGNQSVGSDFVTAVLKNNGQNTFALKAGNAQSGGLTTEYSGTLPTINPGYVPMSLEGAIVLGTGGDNSNGGVGSFFEGVMTAGYPSDATESAVQANIVAAGYTGLSGGTGNSGNKDNGGSVYTGPNDPGGPGPQDGFASPAIQQSNIYMGSKPALASFNGSLYVAFQANDAGHTLHVTSSPDGQTFPVASQKPNIQIGSAPAMAEFNNQLFIAFQANDPVHELWLTSSSDGSSFTSATGFTNILIGSAPAMAVLNRKL